MMDSFSGRAARHRLHRQPLPPAAEGLIVPEGVGQVNGAYRAIDNVTGGIIVAP